MRTVKQRIRMIILLEKMTKQKSYSEKLGIKNISKFHGEYIEREENKEICWLGFLAF